MPMVALALLSAMGTSRMVNKILAPTRLGDFVHVAFLEYLVPQNCMKHILKLFEEVDDSTPVVKRPMQNNITHTLKIHIPFLLPVLGNQTCPIQYLRWFKSLLRKAHTSTWEHISR